MRVDVHVSVDSTVLKLVEKIIAAIDRKQTTAQQRVVDQITQEIATGDAELKKAVEENT